MTRAILIGLTAMFIYIAGAAVSGVSAPACAPLILPTPYAARPAAQDSDNPHEVHIRLLITEKGFEPHWLHVRLSEPLRLEVRNLSSAAQNFVLPDYRIYSFILQKGEAAVIQFTPDKRGNFRFVSDAFGKEDGPQGKLLVR